MIWGSAAVIWGDLGMVVAVIGGGLEMIWESRTKVYTILISPQITVKLTPDHPRYYIPHITLDHGRAIPNDPPNHPRSRPTPQITAKRSGDVGGGG